MEEPLLAAAADEDKSINDEVISSVCASASDYVDFISQSRHQIQNPSVHIKVYKRRWYILFLYGVMSMTQCAVWNTFSPISQIGEHLFNWNTATLSLLTSWGPIAYVVSAFVFSWILDVKGLRPACVLSSFFIAAGTGLRCISSKASVATPLMHLGQFLNGLAGPIAFGAPPALSAEWFPPEQRTTATALAIILNTFGMALSYLLGPYLVPVRFSSNVTSQLIHNNVFHPLSHDRFTYVNNSTNQSHGHEIDMEREDLMKYMYYSFGWSAFCLVLQIIYFPSRPPLPPSTTASKMRLSFRTGLRQLVKNSSFWLICLTYGVPLGVYGGWSGVLDVNLNDHGITQQQAGMIGFYGVVASCIASFFVARGADMFAKHMKWILISLFVLGGGVFLVFALALINTIPFSEGLIYVTYILSTLLIGSASPLFFEMSCEVTYPVAEGVTNLVLTLASNAAALLFLLVQLIPNIGTMWQNWCLIAAIFVCVPVLLQFKERYNRLDADISVDV